MLAPGALRRTAQRGTCSWRSAHVDVWPPSLSQPVPTPRRRGGIYDAVVGTVAVEHELRLVTRDKRTLDAYRTIDVALELLH